VHRITSVGDSDRDQSDRDMSPQHSASSQAQDVAAAQKGRYEVRGHFVAAVASAVWTLAAGEVSDELRWPLDWGVEMIARLSCEELID